ncbi:metallophosphoesterase family protein [Dyadobacter bucti]|uniref:metallophosphoesterase family protein n=1 Tax=Dyadobacter bucti TaxID=2572203 RepID=UPI003F71AB45
MLRRNLLKNIGLLAGGLSLPNLTNAASPEKPSRVLRIAHVTDIHVQPHLWAAKGMEKCLHHIQDLDIRPDVIFNGGDSVMGAGGISKHKASREWNLFHEVLRNENSLPLFSCIGNHDIWANKEHNALFGDGKKWAMDEFKLPEPYYSFDKNGWHFIFLDSIHPQEDGFRYYARLDDKQFDWLENDLRNVDPDTPVMIVSHIPILAACVFLDGDTLQDNEWRVPGSWMHTDAAKLVKLFTKHKNVRLSISGHTHLLDRVEYNGVSYCCNGAVCGNYWFGKTQETRAGYAIIDLFDDGSFKNEYVSYRK